MFVFIYLEENPCIIAYMGSRQQRKGISLLFPHVGPQFGVLVIRFRGTFLYYLIHLTVPKAYFKSQYILSTE